MLQHRIEKARNGRADQSHLAQINDAAIRSLVAQGQTVHVDLTPTEVLALVGEIEEHRRAAGTWKSNQGAHVDYHSSGLIQDRYHVSRGDGRPVDLEARFFVLRYDKSDEWGDACRAALLHLIDKIKDEWPALAEDLRADVATYERCAPAE